MDWTETLEKKKKLRKMAYRMLWADLKNTMLSWNGWLVLLMYLFYFLLPYNKKFDEVNIAAIYYFCIWVLISLGAVAETAFNYIPLSTKDIVYYLKCRTNHLVSWMVLLSVGTGLVLDASGVDVFWERGLISLIFLLSSVEWYFFMALYSYSKPEKVSFLDPEIPTGRKIRIAICNVYCVVAIFANMIVGMFMDYNENAKTKLLVLLCVYLVMYIFRADAARFVKFEEYSKKPNRNMYNTEAFQNQQ